MCFTKVPETTLTNSQPHQKGKGTPTDGGSKKAKLTPGMRKKVGKVGYVDQKTGLPAPLHQKPKNKGKNKSLRASDGPSGTSSNKGKARDSAVDLERTYARECERLAFQYAELSQPSADARGGLVFPAYNYARELEQTAGARRNPKDRLHLVQEYAVMATSLPPGVWVRVDEVRIDMVCVCGCFVFGGGCGGSALGRAGSSSSC